MRGQVTVFIIMGLVVFISAILLLFERPRAEVQVIPIGKNCADGTRTGDCSAAKPLYCESGKLSNDCRTCGCPKGTLCGKEGLCESPKPVQEGFQVFFVPVNYDPNDPEFLARVQQLGESLKSINIRNFAVVEETFNYPTKSCDTILPALHVFAIKWLQHSGEKMKQVKADVVPIYPYRVIGVDKNIQNEALCGCAFTQLFNPTVYVGGSRCSFVPHAALHELGHTFGLCDEYDTCVWEKSGEYLRKTYARGCPNVKPNALNSNCGSECCSAPIACCVGKYAFGTPEWFNVMGSADLPERKVIGTETNALLTSFLCAKLEVCG